jgi:ubiquitin C-terminal hydrolase
VCGKKKTKEREAKNNAKLGKDLGNSLRNHLSDFEIKENNSPLIVNKAQNNTSQSCKRTEDKLFPTGLKNLGMTCYMSTALQGMFHQASLRRAILAWKDNGIYSTGAIVMRELQALFQKMYLQLGASCSVNKLAEALRINPREQQDPEEFLKLFIDLLLDQFPKGDQSAQQLKDRITVFLFIYLYLMLLKF